MMAVKMTDQIGRAKAKLLAYLLHRVFVTASRIAAPEKHRHGSRNRDVGTENSFEDIYASTVRHRTQKYNFHRTVAAHSE